MKLPVLGLAALAVAAAVLPASAASAGPVVTYAHCGSAAKAGVSAATGIPTFVMDGTKPTTSFTANGGCGTLDTDKSNADGIVLTGTRTGLLDQLTVDAHVIDVGGVRAGLFEEVYVNATLTVDGEAFGLGELRLTPVPSATGLSRLLQFSVTGLGLTDPETDAGTHAVTVTLDSANYANGDEAAWVLDATEVPTGVVYGPTTLADVVVDVAPTAEEDDAEE